jgi:hypothetical protein
MSPPSTIAASAGRVPASRRPLASLISPRGAGVSTTLIWLLSAWAAKVEERGVESREQEQFHDSARCEQALPEQGTGQQEQSLGEEAHSEHAEGHHEDTVVGSSTQAKADVGDHDIDHRP